MLWQSQDRFFSQVGGVAQGKLLLSIQRASDQTHSTTKSNNNQAILS